MLPRETWRLVKFLVGRGVLETLDRYNEGRGHTIDCVMEAAQAYKALCAALGEPAVPPPFAASGGTDAGPR